MSSCSFLRGVQPPKVYEPPAELTCTQTRLYPGVDTALSVLFVGSAVALAAGAARASPEQTVASVAISGAVGALAGVSAFYGFTGAARCDQLHAKLKDYEYQQFAASKALSGAGVGARPDAPIPVDSVNGRPVLTWAVVQGAWRLVAKFSDGWRDLDGGRLPEASVTRALLSKEPPVELGTTLVRPPPTEYRGEEGWQGLKWGATAAEVGAAFAVTANIVSPNITELVGDATVINVPSRVIFSMYRGRLAGVLVTVGGGYRKDWESALQSKYGVGESPRLLVTEWKTNETRVVLNGERLETSILYSSLLWSVFSGPEYDRLEREKANKDL